MKIELRPIEEITAAMWAGNPRTISTGELNKLRTSIREFGLVLPIIVNSVTGHVVGGHQRVRAAALEGLTEVPVTTIELAEDREPLLNLALNKIDGEWDYDKLTEVLSNLAEAECFALTGFDEADLVSIFANYDLPNNGGDSFEEFIEKGGQRTESPTVAFKSPEVEFICTRSEYDALVNRMQRVAGVNDNRCNEHFLDVIGLVAA
jgi:ParB-like chromosome segregation protein Spo0J